MANPEAIVGVLSANRRLRKSSRHSPSAVRQSRLSLRESRAASFEVERNTKLPQLSRSETATIAGHNAIRLRPRFKTAMSRRTALGECLLRYPALDNPAAPRKNPARNPS
jgi:hypothetical protein